MLSCHRSYGQYREIPFGISCSQWGSRESNPASRIKSPVRSRYARDPQSSITTPKTPKATSVFFRVAFAQSVLGVSLPGIVLLECDAGDKCRGITGVAGGQTRPRGRSIVLAMLQSAIW